MEKTLRRCGLRSGKGLGVKKASEWLIVASVTDVFGVVGSSGKAGRGKGFEMDSKSCGRLEKTFSII